jgi:hypothetical protein
MVWQIAACFCAGAALWKVGFFRGATPRLERAMIWLGVLVGLPLQVAGAWATMHDTEAYHGIAMLLMQVGGPMVSAAYLALGLRLAARFADAGPVRAVASLGAMGLTGYLGVSLLMSFTLQHWGLGAGRVAGDGRLRVAVVGAVRVRAARVGVEVVHATGDGALAAAQPRARRGGLGRGLTLVIGGARSGPRSRETFEGPSERPRPRVRRAGPGVESRRTR